MTANYDWAYWDVNQGPSVAYEQYQYQRRHSSLILAKVSSPHSESFQILGSEAVPEPGSLVLLSSGALLLAVRHFRQRAGRVSRG